jgi:iron complex transport system ATP-binding protein
MNPPGHPSPSPHLEAERLSFAYPSRGLSSFELTDVSTSMPRGSITGLLGPNGGGKSTLLKMLAGIMTPASGRVLLNGQPVSMFSRRDVARRIAVVPQGTHPAFDYTVMEMVLMGRHPHLGMFELEGPGDIEIARDAMHATATGHLAERSFLTLSGGEQQRVALASALAQSPEVLLLDEPTASLDLGYQLEIASLLRRLNSDRGVTMVVATHDLNFAASVCDRLVLLRQGRVLGEGATATTLTRDAIRDLYQVEAEVGTHQTTGRLVVVPTRRVS